MAALVENSAPDRTALAVLGQATGATLTSWDVHALDGRGLSADPSSADHLRLFGDWLVHAGPLDEWRAQDGSFASSAPAHQELPGLTRLQMTGVHGRSTTSSAMWFLGDDNACQRRGALDGQGSWIHDRDTLVALELCTDTSPARVALLGIDPTSGAERWRVSVPGFDAWAAGLDGPVPTLSSSPWLVTFHSLPSSAPTDEGGTDEGETAEGGADKDGPSVPTDPGTDAFEVVDGVGHRIATSTGEILQTQG